MKYLLIIAILLLLSCNDETTWDELVSEINFSDDTVLADGSSMINFTIKLNETEANMTLPNNDASLSENKTTENKTQ